MHTCSSCHEVFEATTNRPRDISWKSLFTRAAEVFPLRKDIGSFDLVKCPKCGHVEKSEEFRIFGFIPGSSRNIKLVLFWLRVVRCLPVCAEASKLGEAWGQALDKPPGRKPQGRADEDQRRRDAMGI